MVDSEEAVLYQEPEQKVQLHLFVTLLADSQVIGV